MVELDFSVLDRIRMEQQQTQDYGKSKPKYLPLVNTSVLHAMLPSRSPALELLESSIMFIVKQSDTSLAQPEAVLGGLRNISEGDFWGLWKGTFPDLAAREGYFDRVWGGRDKFLASRGEYFENTWGGAKYLIRRIGRILEKHKPNG